VAVSCKSKVQTFQGDLSDILLLEDNSDERDTARLPTDWHKNRYINTIFVEIGGILQNFAY